MTYTSSAKFYDLFGSKNDLEFYRELALQSGRKALELGVGTARVAIYLAKAGVTVYGIDNSIHILRVAEQKLASETEAVRGRVTLKEGDMRNFELKQSFPFIYMPASTFGHNLTAEEQSQTLGSIYKHLEKNGVFAFDLEISDPDRPTSSWWIDRKELEDGKLIVRSIFTRRDYTRRICGLDLFFDVYRDGKMLERYHEFSKASMISRDMIIQLLENTGFSIEGLYGDFNGSEYQEDGEKIVLVTRKI
jgi:ubiquinone/menaquinone biosynthesis C-methylase UbiE